MCLGVVKQTLTDAKGESPVAEAPRTRPVHFCDSMSLTNLPKYMTLSFAGFTQGRKGNGSISLLMKKKTVLLWIIYGNNKYNCRTEGKKGKKSKKK